MLGRGGGGGVILRSILLIRQTSVTIKWLRASIAALGTNGRVGVLEWKPDGSGPLVGVHAGPGGATRSAGSKTAAFQHLHKLV